MQELKFGFIILCIERATHLVKITTKSMQNNYADRPMICIADESCNDEDMADLNACCPSFRAGNTVSSLINLGFKKTQIDWNMIVMAGTMMRKKIDYRYSRFLTSENDVLYPVVSRKMNFVDGTINGLLINKKLFDKAGDWDNNLSFERCKLLWAGHALEHQCQFKGIVGVKLC